MAFKIVSDFGYGIGHIKWSAARDVPTKPAEDNNLEVEDSSSTLVDCWNALTEIKSCSNEIILFFLNGQTDIVPGCCRSVTTISHNCWPAMLTSLGFTAEEGNVLGGDCDAASSSPPSPGPVAAPSPAVGSHLQYRPQGNFMVLV